MCLGAGGGRGSRWRCRRARKRQEVTSGRAQGRPNRAWKAFVGTSGDATLRFHRSTLAVAMSSAGGRQGFCKVVVGSAAGELRREGSGDAGGRREGVHGAPPHTCRARHSSLWGQRAGHGWRLWWGHWGLCKCFSGHLEQGREGGGLRKRCETWTGEEEKETSGLAVGGCG